MKHYFRYKTIHSLMVLLVIISFSCTKDFKKTNTPANQLIADNLDIKLLGQVFANSQFFGLCGDNQSFQRSHSLFSDLYAQYFAATEPNFDSDKFIEVQGWTNRYYNDVYSNGLPGTLFVKNFARKSGNESMLAMAMVWEVEEFHRISDFFGPVIYSNFGNGKTSVDYDSQEIAYRTFFKVLDTAVNILKNHHGENIFGLNDIVFGGNLDKWLTFANSLRLRLAMRISYVDPTSAKIEAEKAVKDGVMINNSDNANVATTVNNLNFYTSITYIDEFRMSATMESILGGFNDPRMSIYFTSAQDGSGFRGVRNGLPRLKMGKFLNPTHAAINNAWRPLDRGGKNPPNHVMEAAEVYFLRAEGALRGWDMGDEAESLYNKGIRVSMEQWGISVGVDDYINSENVPKELNDEWNTPAAGDVPIKFNKNGSFEDKLEQIITQKWIALYPDSWEAWSERRRTGYPVGLPIVQSLNPNIGVNEHMRRLKFTTGEISNNRAAVEKARTLLNGPDENNTRLWWDAKP